MDTPPFLYTLVCRSMKCLLLLDGEIVYKLVKGKKDLAYLQIVQGTPYGKGTYIPLERDNFIIGRSTNSLPVDISFDNFLISRKHCCVRYCKDEWYIADLGSKHGTSVNDQSLAPQKEYALKSGDKVMLASGIVVFHFIDSGEFGKTLDFDRTQTMRVEDDLTFASHVKIDVDRMTLVIDNLAISLSVKEWLFLETLHRQRGKVVGYEDIKKAVWSERYTADNNFSAVGFDEVNMVCYRLRRKFGKYSKIIKTIRGRGCILDL